MPFRISRPWLTGNPVWHLTGKLFPRTFPPACFSPSGLASGQANTGDCLKRPPLRNYWRHRQCRKRGKKPPAEQPCVTRTIRMTGEAAGASRIRKISGVSRAFLLPLGQGQGCRLPSHAFSVLRTAAAFRPAGDAATKTVRIPAGGPGRTPAPAPGQHNMQYNQQVMHSEYRRYLYPH